MVQISVLSERKNPSLSASKISTKDFSGISKPSRNRLVPINTSKTTKRKSQIIYIRLTVSISECK